MTRRSSKFKMFRRLTAVKVLVLLLILSALPVQAESPPISVTLDGKSLAFDVPPALTGGRVMVPLRKIFESLGAKVEYNAATGRIVGVRGDTMVVLNAGSSKATVDGKEVALSAAPQLVGGRALVPLRFVSEALGDKVDWDANARTVIVTSDIDRNAPPLQAGWYRVSGTVKDARTNAPVAGVQVVARTEYDIAAGDPGAAPATGGTASPEPATGTPSSGGIGTSEPSTGGAVRGKPPLALGAPGVPDQSDTGAPASGGDNTSGTTGTGGTDGGTDGASGTGSTLPVYEFKTETGANGAYRLELPAGAAHLVSLTGSCFAKQAFLVTGTTRRDVRLQPGTPSFSTPIAAGTFRVHGQVKDQQGQPVSSACVTATPPAGSATPAGQTLPAVTQYLTDESGNFFVDWPAWKAIKIKATQENCEGKGIGIIWGKPPITGEGGPRNAGGPPNPEPVAEYTEIPANPIVVKDLSMNCLPPPAEWSLAVTIPAGGTATTVCEQGVGTDTGYVSLTRTGSWLTTGQNQNLTASPVGDKSKPVLLRWWLNDPKGGTLYASGCKASYVAPSSLGIAYQTSAYVSVAKEGGSKPYTGDVTGSGRGFLRIMIYDARNAPSGGGGAGCTTATYSVTATAAYGLITRLDIQGVGTWFSLGTGTFTVTNVPVGRYTVWVTMTNAGTRTLQVQIGCPVTRSYFK